MSMPDPYSCLRSNIARLEAGRHAPAIPTIKRIADALKMDLSSILEKPAYNATAEDRRWIASGMSEWSESLKRDDGK
jgi:transcriptional regulator with XRE-family HTH domain